jgi:hypothetical protein
LRAELRAVERFAAVFLPPLEAAAFEGAARFAAVFLPPLEAAAFDGARRDAELFAFERDAELFTFEREDELLVFELRVFEPLDFERDDEVFDFDRAEPDLERDDELAACVLAVGADSVSPASARSLLTVRAAISFARAGDFPLSRSLSLMCSYWRASFVPFFTPRGGMSSPPRDR